VEASKNSKGPIKMEYQFEKLKIWQMGMDMAQQIYVVTKQFPDEEKFGLIAQMRRAAFSVPSNIAEGKGRFHTKEFIQFLYIAREITGGINGLISRFK
jgi:hypothetical protein